MAQLKSTSITNRDATPRVFNSAANGAPGDVKEVFEYVTATGTVGDIITLIEVPSTARVGSVQWQAAAMTAGAFDIGVYRNTAAGGAVVDADLFASAVSAATAVTPTEVKHESGVYAIDDQNKPLWEAAGLTADPGGTLDICATITTAVTVAGLLGLKVQYR